MRRSKIASRGEKTTLLTRGTSGRQIIRSLSKLTIAIRTVREDVRLVNQSVTMMRRKMGTVTRRRRSLQGLCSMKQES